MALTLCISKIIPIYRTNRSSIEFALHFHSFNTYFISHQ